jgi:hypothetical protein
MELLILQVLSEHWPLMLLSFISDHMDIWCPFFELRHPVIYRRQWYHNQEGSLIVLMLDQVRKQGNSLNRFAQTHFICQNTVQVIVIQ